MQTKRLEEGFALTAGGKEQRELKALIHRMLGNPPPPRRPLRQTRQEVSKQLDGISVSRLIIEAR
ncbi:MAG: hypothetical protein HY673_15935 [Chloroflexi bacterium]|nr:hypothetical protein [Chloroflexota bacterium]